MIPPILRSLIFLTEIWRLVGPFLAKKGKQKVPISLKEGALFVLLNWDIIWKLLEKQRWTVDAVKKMFKKSSKL